MRRLLFVPLIHDEADLGMAGRALAEESMALLGEERWLAHQRTMDRFWERVADFLLAHDPRQLKVYQDGLAAEGELGRRIVEEAARRGSKNYQLVLELLNRGAELRMTEDLALLLQEQASMSRPMQQSPDVAGPRGAEQQRQRDRLLEERDQFIAKTIRATLQEEETGVLFLGAEHNVLAHLPGDITAVALKDPEQMMTYFRVMLQGKDDRNLAELAQYLAAPVRAS